jgi:phosphoenolpyruvate synthase/pyruvate phosphate dikinase
MSGAITKYGKWRIKPSGKLPIFLRFIINSSLSHKLFKKTHFQNHVVDRVYLNHMMYWPAKQYDPFEKEIINHLQKQDGWIDRYCKSELERSEELYEWGLKLKKIDWSKKTNQDMKLILDDLIPKYQRLIVTWYAQYSIDEYYEKTIEDNLLKKINFNDPNFRKIVLIFTDPKKMTDVAEERWKLMKLAQKFKKNKENLNKLSNSAQKDINKHLDKFSYINRGLATSKPYTFKDIIDRLKEVRQSKQKIDDLIYYSSEKKTKDDYEWALNKVKPDKKFKKIIEGAQMHSYTRNRRVEAFFLADYGASFMYREIAQRSNFNPDWIMEISVPEMYGALEEGNILPDKKEMEKRFKNYAMISKDGQTELIVDRKKIKELEKIYKIDNTKVDEIKGNMACLGGIIRGKAKVCLDKKEISKVKRGDILIAQFTTPDFVPAMEKAAAIVADQGGLSSHAAIVSRELGVPCVIATVNGTRIIKDNDLLEIDAQKGIVKIIKKS